jgi:predicted AlkP superfamily pyrophosphatase or phosphodiesterase
LAKFPSGFWWKHTLFQRGMIAAAIFLAGSISLAPRAAAQAPQPRTAAPKASQAPARPKLVVLLVVDQMRGDYVDKFLGQWTGGLKRLVEEGAWFRDAAYPYAATETCVGHATISTGAFPATHGMVANGWWDRELGKSVTCTSDSKAKNSAYGGSSFKDGDSESEEKDGGNSGVHLALPSFADELRFQAGTRTRVVTFSLKARAAITLAGHQANGVVWYDDTTGAWVTSNRFGTLSFLDDYMKKNPVRKDYGKTWNLRLDKRNYLYPEEAIRAVPPDGWDHSFPHPLRGKAAGRDPDAAFYKQWKTSPFADTYLTQLAELAVDQLGLGEGEGTDFLGIAYSPLDYAGHAFGPRSWEVQDILVQLDEDLAHLFMHLDKEVGRGNYVVALSADHGVVPIPEDMQETGADAGVLHLPELQERIEKALEPFNYAKPAVARISGSDICFAPGVYDKLQRDRAALQAVLDAALAQPGVAAIYRAEELRDRPATQNPSHRAFAYSYFPGRSGDLFILPKPYWLMDSTALGKTRSYGTGHGVPYNYDQHVPVLLMGFGIQPGQYFQPITPADIAPTFAALCGITLSSRDGHVLAEALKKPAAPLAASQPARPKSAPASAPNTNP